jgi:nitroreductase
MESLLKNNDKDNIEWSAKQVYLALGIGLLAAAEEKIDSTLMEGFNRQQLDEFLRLKEKGLRSFVLMALGYRDIQNDYLVNLNKVRREKRKFFMKFQ